MAVNAGAVVDIGAFHDLALPQRPVCHLGPEIGAEGFRAVDASALAEQTGVRAAKPVEPDNGDLPMLQFPAANSGIAPVEVKLK